MDSLISVVVGGLIATIPILINNRFQAKERDKDRDEARKEAKTQLALELTKNDIKDLENTIDGYLRGIGELRRIRLKYRDTEDSKEKMEKEFQLKVAQQDSFYNLVHVNVVADKLAYTLGDEFYSEYRNYKRMIRECLDLLLSPPYQHDKEPALTSKIVISAGKLHTMLRNVSMS